MHVRWFEAEIEPLDLREVPVASKNHDSRGKAFLVESRFLQVFEEVCG